MHYFSGICNLNDTKKVSNLNLKKMLFGSGENKFFLNDNFGACLRWPKNHNSILAIPLFAQSNDCKTVVIFEGRIDNKSELLDKLPDKDKRQEYSYAELVLFLYESFNLKFLNDLEGSFAFLIWDKRKKELILHRDKVGLKPLYYCIQKNTLVFGTFLESLFKSHLIKKEINFEWISSYFFMDGLNVGSDTEYAGVKQLMPGKILIANQKEIRFKEVGFKEKFNLTELDEEKMTADFRKIMFGSIKRTLGMSPVSLAFSGGIDTKIILAASKKYNFPIETFTVEFESQAEYKKMDYQLAEKTSERFKTKHYKFKLSPKKFLKNIEVFIKSSGRLINFNNLNSVFILELISGYGDLIVTGDGTEEQLSFYQHHLFPFSSDLLLENIPLENAKKLKKLILETYCNLFFSRSWEWRDTGLNENEKVFKMNLFTNSALKKVDKHGVSKIFYNCFSNAPDTIFSPYKNSSMPSFFNKALWIDFSNNFRPKIFAVYDIVSRLKSVEIRSPFLDSNFVNFSSKLPALFKFRSGTKLGKYIMRKAVEKLIGKKDAYTTFKSGSDIPFDEWLSDPYFEKYVRSILNKKRIKKYGILNPDYVEKVVNEHYKEKGLFKEPRFGRINKKGRDHTHKILKLLGFQLWMENNF